ncbi:hypothetical protein M501DRAFT_943591 [Patellaria atrata CBS 101060]|uniref:Uncharacterized protein n=1 Tax=Patellaria atrata CBS 101060 TaxID=1346257 RepID=A0A9P4S1Y8_9PEZI|nr:hypothetical protein M501DRAFT_943591 [Patellaria atrata CBS 101060]
MANPVCQWFFTPLQAVATIASAVNCGGSLFQPLMVMPLLGPSVNIPIQYQGTQVIRLLADSEFWFPKINAMATLSNLILTGFAMRYSSASPLAAEKLKYYIAAASLNLATTVWTLGFMAPKYNTPLKRLAKSMDERAYKGQEFASEEKEFRGVQKEWMTGAYVRGAIMLGAAVASIMPFMVSV